MFKNLGIASKKRQKMYSHNNNQVTNHIDQCNRNTPGSDEIGHQGE